MRRTIKVRAKDDNRGTIITVQAKIKTNGYFVRDEVQEIYDSLKEQIVDTLRKSVVKFDARLDDIRY